MLSSSSQTRFGASLATRWSTWRPCSFPRPILPPVSPSLSMLMHKTNRNNNSRLFSSSSETSRLGLGGYKWSRLDPDRYDEIVKTALENNIFLLEAGLGGEFALAQAIRKAIHDRPSILDNSPITILQRVGYRTVTQPKVIIEDDDDETTLLQKKKNAQDVSDVSTFPGDVLVEEQNDLENNKVAKIFHNLSPNYLKHVFSPHSSAKTQPWIELAREFDRPDCLQVKVLLHNPEAQALRVIDPENANDTENTSPDSQTIIRDALVKAFLALQDLVQEGDNCVHSYGIVSNGLALPKDHPLFLSHTTILSALQKTHERWIAKNENDKTKKQKQQLDFSVVQVPFNLLETTGKEVAKKLKQEVNKGFEKGQTEKETKLSPLPRFDVYAMRPLACYLDRGTGTGHPFLLADYRLPVTEKEKHHFKWTNEMKDPPELYRVALKQAVAHFDATDLIQAKLDGKELSAQDRETLDGCKLLQSLLYDVDHGLDKLRSLAAQEEDLVQKVIPLIEDTFEGYDEETGDMLQKFFKAYSLAVRFAVARNTRKLLTQGEVKSNIPVFRDLEPHVHLQEYGLKFVLKEPVFDKVIVNCTEADQVTENIDICRKMKENDVKENDASVNNNNNENGKKETA